MERFQTASASGEDWQATVESALEQLGPVSPGANLGFVYLTDALANDFEPVVHTLRKATGVKQWVGTVGVGVCHNDREYYDMPAIATMVGRFPDNSFRVFPTLEPDLSDLVDELKPWYSQHGQHLAVVHGDPRAAATPDQIAMLAYTVPNIYLVGGLTSSRDRCPQYANKPCEGGLSGVLFNQQEVPAAASLTQGCSPIGPVRTVGRARHNIISTIDDRPALEVFKEDIGEVLARDLNRVAGYIFVALPVAGSDTKDYAVRNLLGIDPRGGELIIGDTVQPGQSVLFVRRDGHTAWDDLSQTLGELRARVDAPIKGALYFSCLGRGRHLFGEDSDELRFIQRQLGDIPLVGFFANGEIARHQLYGYTGVLTLFL